MNRRKVKTFHLIRILLLNAQAVALISALSVVIGFTFLFTVTSLSETIIRSKQDAAVRTYGKFLMAAPGIDKKTEKKLRAQYDWLAYEHYGVLGNAEYGNSKFTMATMKESMGEILGFRLIGGVWPEDSRQIVVEEYLLDLFGIGKEDLPADVSLNMGGEIKTYEITGAISNYSYLLSNYNDGYLETKVYPSAICGQRGVQDAKQTLVVLQKKLDFKQAGEDIEQLANNFMLDVQCINVGIYFEGYSENEDMADTKVMYLVLLNFLMLAEQIVIIRTILLKNRETISLFQALGMSARERRKLLFLLTQGFVWLGILAGCLFSALIGSTWIGRLFRGYDKYYMQSLIGSVLMEGAIAAQLLSGVYLLWHTSGRFSVQRGIFEGRKKRPGSGKYRFKKVSVSIAAAQTVCLFFTLASFHFALSFSEDIDAKAIDYDLCSKKDTVSCPLKDYQMAMYGDNYFTFDALDAFEKYRDDITISAEAEALQSTILFEKQQADSFFRQYLEESVEEMRPEYEALWKQVSREAGKYEALSEIQMNIIVLPQREFQLYLKKHHIENPNLEKNTERTCILQLPREAKLPAHPSIREKGTFLLGGIRGNEKKADFFSEEFTAEEIVRSDQEEDNIKVIMSEETAQKSKTVVGYDTITISMDKSTPRSVQESVDKRVSLLMASVQGGVLYSSGQRGERDRLVRRYGSLMSDTMLVFSILIICVYIILSIQTDWERHRYEYGVLRSFGMSYSALQRRLFIRYSSSIVIACILNVYLGKLAFTNGTLTRAHILFSVCLIVASTYFCRIWVYFQKRKQPVSEMLHM